ncbi:dTMP kinase [uncultured Paludibaculum sp.]|uniref:dTMP kinase n=1 Tax=uncultured Paludibaculum sp. TaxID=1765020 RepID=UPI002AAAD70A|nr:dTMP kinase [uncultured Paludibaculum sp.]
MSMTTRRGLFLTFEGLDGCGKTTQMRMLAERLRAAGDTVIETAEPGGTDIGGAIRRILLDPANHHLSPTAEMLLYFAARAQNVDEIVTPATARGEIVLCDRWTDSTWAYQGYGRALGVDVIRTLDRIACRGRQPDLTLWIDVDLETSLGRAKSRNVQEDSADTRMDDQSRAFYERVLQGYQALEAEEPGRVVRVDGRGDLETVAGRVWQVFHDYRELHV